MSMLRIGFLNWYNPKDRKSLSGTTYKICESLENIGYDVKWIRVKRTITYKIFSKAILFVSKFLGKNIDFTHSIIGASLQSKTIDIKSIEDCDIVFAAFASEALYHINTDKPIVYLSDATFNAMVGYYFKNLCRFSILQGNKVEKRALDKADLIIVSSNWAYNSVIMDYNQPKEKVHVVEFGANIDDKDIIQHKFYYDGHLDILFIGVDWKRKGLRIAVSACEYLYNEGINTTLHIVGAKKIDDDIEKLPYVNYVGFLDKNVSEQYNKMISIIQKCHCLLLPTLAECAGIAFCESSANGLPVFSHDTGGVRNYVKDGYNGYLLPIGSIGADFGMKIKDCLISGELEKMSETAKIFYKEKLNWKVWGDKMDTLINKIAHK